MLFQGNVAYPTIKDYVLLKLAISEIMYVEYNQIRFQCIHVCKIIICAHYMEKSVHDNELRYVRIAETSFQRNELR